MRKSWLQPVVFCVAVLFQPAAFAQEDLSKVEIKTDGVWGKGFLPPEKFVAMLYGNVKKRGEKR